MSGSVQLRIGETILGLFTLGLGLFIGIDTWLTPAAAAQAVVGPGVFPALVATGLILVGLRLLYEGFALRAVAEVFPQLDRKAVAIVAFAIALQYFILERFGWIISGTLLFVLTSLAFGSRKHIRNVLFGLVLTTLTYMIFDYGLDLDLPTGTLIEDLVDGPVDG